MLRLCIPIWDKLARIYFGGKLCPKKLRTKGCNMQQKNHTCQISIGMSQLQVCIKYIANYCWNSISIYSDNTAFVWQNDNEFFLQRMKRTAPFFEAAHFSLSDNLGDVKTRADKTLHVGHTFMCRIVYLCISFIFHRTVSRFHYTKSIKHEEERIYLICCNRVVGKALRCGHFL